VYTKSILYAGGPEEGVFGTGRLGSRESCVVDVLFCHGRNPRRTWVDGGAKEMGFRFACDGGWVCGRVCGGLRRCSEMGEEGFVMWWFEVAMPRVFG
jgi:hypothetical protein